jgi:hypothetical protein
MMETDQLSLGYVGVEVNDEGFRSTVRQDWNEHTGEGPIMSKTRE